LRLAESLDRSHMGLVMDVRFTGDSGDRVHLNIHAPEDCHLEMKGVENESANFERIFRKKMVLQIQNSGHSDI
ncbi:MAG: hypothetical protein LUQ25_02845, partial [Methanoregulaceae archaeon]|nr:hypothetical protein [Methanoregulaceae archaeon]